MGKKIVPFKGTKEQEEKLMACLKRIKAGNPDGALMPSLQHAQEIYGYLPKEVQLIIADFLGISLEEVYGVVTFYSQFTLNPVGKYKIGVCLGTACYVKGSGDIIEKFERTLGIKRGETTPDGKFSIEATRCIGCCGLAPVFTVNEEVYGKATPNDVGPVLHMYNLKKD